MKYTTALFIFFNALFALAHGADTVGAGCSADVTLTARPSASWSTGDGKMSQIFDISVKNAGSCPLTNVGLNFDFPESSTITQEWNLVPDTRYTLISNFGPSIAVGATVTAGVVVSIPEASFSDLVGSAVHVYGSTCPDSCVNPASPAPSSAPAQPSSAPTSSAPSSPSSTPTSDPSAPAPNCQGNAEAVARAQAPWTDAQGYTYQIYDVVVNNTGTCPFTTLATYFTGNITQAWNYDIPSGSISGYGSLSGGQVYRGAGFVLATSPTPVAGVPSTPVLGRMVTRCGAPCSA